MDEEGRRNLLMIQKGKKVKKNLLFFLLHK